MKQCYVWDYEDQFAKACERLPGMAIAHSAMPVHNRAKGGCQCDRCKFYREFVIGGGWIRELEGSGIVGGQGG